MELFQKKVTQNVLLEKQRAVLINLLETFAAISNAFESPKTMIVFFAKMFLVTFPWHVECSFASTDEFVPSQVRNVFGQKLEKVKKVYVPFPKKLSETFLSTGRNLF